ncbi:DUF202 domain-containing protein [Modestobacter versicolor]|uniref:DUF202 domain-containing protein n=1 Tax=Modestobacter versicolor TaxID=429133 RepID=UPI0034DF9F1F
MSSPGGTQPARTALAWQRTGLGVLLVAGLLARAAAERGDLRLVAPAAVVAVAGLVVLGLLAPRRQRETERAARTGADGRAPRATVQVTGLVVLVAACALAGELLQRT